MSVSVLTALAIASLLSGVAGAGMSHIERATDRQHDIAMQEQAFENQKEINEIEHQFQKEMRDSSITSQVNQLQSAGVNTAMYFSGNSASGAATPSAGSGTGSYSSSNSAHSNIGSVLNGVASVANAFNNDKDNSNNINLKQALGMISNVASIFK